MKTTMEINDELLRQVRQIVRRDGVTLRSLVEQGLRLILKSRNAPPPRERPEPLVFKGKPGFGPAFEGRDWAAFKEEARRR